MLPRLRCTHSDGTPRGWNRTRFRTRILVDFEVPQLQVLELLFLPDHHRTHLHLQVNRGAEVDSDSKISYDLLPTDIFWLCPYSVVAAQREYPEIRFHTIPFPTHAPLNRTPLESRAYDLIYSGTHLGEAQVLLEPPVPGPLERVALEGN